MSRRMAMPINARAALEAAREAYDHMNDVVQGIVINVADAVEAVEALDRSMVEALDWSMVEGTASAQEPPRMTDESLREVRRILNDEWHNGGFTLEILSRSSVMIYRFLQSGGQIWIGESPISRDLIIEMSYGQVNYDHQISYESLINARVILDLIILSCEHGIHEVMMEVNRRANAPQFVGSTFPPDRPYAYIQDVRTYDRPLTTAEMEQISTMGPHADLDAMRRRYEQDREQQEAALKRSREFLFEYLNDDQRKQMETEGYFSLIAPSGRYYEIKPLNSFNVFVMSDTHWAVGYEGWRGVMCVQPDGVNVPIYDQMLMQKLMIETDEENFIAIANVRGLELIKIQQEIRAKRHVENVDHVDALLGWTTTPGDWPSLYSSTLWD